MTSGQPSLGWPVEAFRLKQHFENNNGLAVLFGASERLSKGRMEMALSGLWGVAAAGTGARTRLWTRAGC